MSALDRNREDFINGLRDLASFLEAHPAVAIPYIATIYAFPGTVDQAREMTHLSGPWTKTYLGEHAGYEKTFGEGSVEFKLSIPREQVCQRVQTGTRIEPATEAREIPIYEWQCVPTSDEDPGLGDAAELSRVESSACDS